MPVPYSPKLSQDLNFANSKFFPQISRTLNFENDLIFANFADFAGGLIFPNFVCIEFRGFRAPGCACVSV